MTTSNAKNNKTKTATTILSALLIGLILFYPVTVMPSVNGQTTDPSSSAKNLAGTTTVNFSKMRILDNAALKKAGFIATPIGYLPPECIYHVGDNARINKDGSVDLANGTHLVVPPCKYRATTSPNNPGPLFPTNSWVEHAAQCYHNCPSSPPAIMDMSGKWTVPPTPTSSDGQTIYLWLGLQPTSTGGTGGLPLVQPVLQWGYGGSQNYWAIDSWYCDPTNNCYASSSVATSAGSTITGTLTGSSCSSGACKWLIQTSDGTHTTNLQYTSTTPLYWMDGAVLEVWNVIQCSDYPAEKTGGTTFGSFSITDANSNSVTPSWSGTVDQNDGCNENYNISGTQATLYYGP